MFRKDPEESPLTDTEIKIYRKFIGKLLWLSENVRPDWAFSALDMSRKVKKAMLKDLKDIQQIHSQASTRKRE